MERLYSRCLGYTKTQKRCRRRLVEGQWMFCSKAHEPINWDDIDECYICGQESKQVYILACGHATHAPCLEQWFRTQKPRVCPLCRKETMRPIGS